MPLFVVDFLNFSCEEKFIFGGVEFNELINKRM